MVSIVMVLALAGTGVDMANSKFDLGVVIAFDFVGNVR